MRRILSKHGGNSRASSRLRYLCIHDVNGNDVSTVTVRSEDNVESDGDVINFVHITLSGKKFLADKR